jgi:hypothetical protein
MAKMEFNTGIETLTIFLVPVVAAVHGRVFVVENLNVQGLAGGRLAKSVQDASGAALVCKIAYRAENAGRTLIESSKGLG